MLLLLLIMNLVQLALNIFMIIDMTARLKELRTTHNLRATGDIEIPEELRHHLEYRIPL
jgi:hypothetical protein